MATNRQVAFLPSRLRADIVGYLADEMISHLVVRTDYQVKGDEVRFPHRGALTVNSINYATSDNPTRTLQTPSATSVVIAIDQYPDISILIPTIDQASIDYDNIAEGYKQDGARALGENIDGNVFGQYASMGTVVGAAGSTLNENIILTAKQKLDEKKVPKRDRHLVLGPVGTNDLLAVDRITTPEKYGSAIIPMGELGMIHGFRTWMTNQVSSNTTSEFNLAFHPFCMGLAFLQERLMVELWYSGINRGNVISINADYGYGVLTASCGVQVVSSPT